MQINDLKLAAQLRNTLGKMELSLAAIDNGIAWTNETGKVQWCNDTFTRLAGAPYIKILNQDFCKFLPLKLNDQTLSTEQLITLSKKNTGGLIYKLETNEHTVQLLEVTSNQFSYSKRSTNYIIVIRDVTERERALEKIKFLASIPERNPAPVFSISKKNDVIYSNKSTLPLLKFWKDKGYKIPPSLIILKDKVLKTKREHVAEEVIDNKIFLVSVTIGSEPDHVNIYCTDITERKKAVKELQYLANHDVLTKLNNRSAFEKKLLGEIEHAKQSKTAFAMLLIDLDNFKTVNDTFGHHVGDQLLILVAKELQKSVRKEDFVARLGGDEFVILIPAIQDKETIHALARSLVKRFNRPFKLDNHYFKATISIGIALSSEIGLDSTTLVKNADLALYAVKDLGRNNYRFYTDLISNDFERRRLLEANLGTALENNQFFLVYQPQFKLPDKEIIGIEVLLRWQHPKLGLIMPDEFICLAEKTGFIVQIGEWVLKNACNQYSKWLSEGCIPQNVKLAVNISLKQLEYEGFMKSLITILKESNLPSDKLELELTETDIMTSNVNLDPVIEELQQIGIYISIDDFGMGYSSLSRLNNLPVYALKIDKSFVENIANNPNNATIVKSILALGENLGLKVVTEGVETEEQLQFLLKHRCKTVQGFYFGKKPLSHVEMTHFLKNTEKQLS